MWRSPPAAESPTRFSVSKLAGAAVESEYYVYSGHRYCWYDDGWHGGGWYWCGENFHQGIGWGGPIGWHWWVASPRPQAAPASQTASQAASETGTEAGPEAA